MLQRLCNPLLSQSFFLFGARGTGKTTLLKQLLPEKHHLRFDFLDPSLEELYSLNPKRFQEDIVFKWKQGSWVILDEIQRVPKLLNIVHSLIESHQVPFAITGSSARKLRRGQANLLAGRAFMNYLYPLTAKELASQFDLSQALTWGLLPQIWSQKNAHYTEIEKIEYLKSYVLTYVQEEIKMEQLIRNLDPFRRFLEVAAQCNGKILNYSHIQRDVGVDIKTIQNYYSILEDTMLGTFLEPFHTSVRKGLGQKPKFYFFDLGIQRTLAKQISLPCVPRTSYYGELFESFFIMEFCRLSQYMRKNHKFSFLHTRDDLEIDFIVENPSGKRHFIEIKSGTEVKDDQLRRIQKLSLDFPKDHFICAYGGQERRKTGSIEITPWQTAIEEILSY